MVQQPLARGLKLLRADQLVLQQPAQAQAAPHVRRQRSQLVRLLLPARLDGGGLAPVRLQQQQQQQLCALHARGKEWTTHAHTHN